MDNMLVDVIKILDLQYPNRLKSLNGSIFFFENIADEVYKETSYSIKKGYYEASNVNLTGQLSQIPVIKNVYDANTKSVKLILKSLNAGISIGNPQ